MKQQPRRGPVASRLGPLKVKVTNNLSFDARQKIKQKQQQQQQKQQQPNKPSVKVRIGNNSVQDARQKIMQKTKFVDARVRIQNKKADGNKTATSGQPGDMRIKINNAKAKKGQVAIKRTPAGQGATQVTVTGQGRLLTKPGGGVQAVNGSLVKVITQSQQEGSAVKFKGKLKSPEERQNRFQAKSASTNIRVTKSVNFDEISSTPASSLPGGGGVIRVRNEFFKPPQPTPIVIQPQPPARLYQQQVVQRVPSVEDGMEQAAVYVPQILPEHFDVAPVVRSPQPMMYQSEMPTSFRKTVHNTPTYAAPPPKVVPAVTDIVSPSQGVRVVITNLHPVVTEEDVVELFSVAGDLRRARLLRPGTAEVLYGTREHAISAVRKYNHRELDGMPMTVAIVGQPAVRKVPVAARLEASPSPPPPPPPMATPQYRQPTAPTQPQREAGQEFQPLKLFKAPAKGTPASKSNIDVTSVHKALFKTKEPGPVKPVTFTVKI